MSDEILSSDQSTMPPSYFVSLGHPSCSRWGKTEIECIALAYVQALANDGDTWKKLSKRQIYNLLSDEQRGSLHGLLTFESDIYDHWFALVSKQITDSDSAFGVGGYWNRNRRLP